MSPNAPDLRKGRSHCISENDPHYAAERRVAKRSDIEKVRGCRNHQEFSYYFGGGVSFPCSPRQLS
jgi:hypothetical protein